MGKLRIETKHKPPGFTKLQIVTPALLAGTTSEEARADYSESSIRLITCQGTVVQLNREMSLKQVARLVRMLDGSLQV